MLYGRGSVETTVIIGVKHVHLLQSTVDKANANNLVLVTGDINVKMRNSEARD